MIATTAITKAVIPSAGLGQRLNPITKVLSKEMFPIGNYPAIEWVIAEAAASGCTEVAVIISPRKQIIEEYLTTCCPELTNHCRLTFLVQPEPLGLGHALWLAREFCQGEPFAILLPDILVGSTQLALEQLVPVFEAFGGVVEAITRERSEHAGRYGRLQLEQIDEGVYRLKGILPRTTPVRTPSVLAGVGRTLVSPEYLEYADRLVDKPRIGELDDGILLQYMIDIGEPVHCVHIEGQRYDISTPDGYIGAWDRFGKEKPRWQYL